MLYLTILPLLLACGRAPPPTPTPAALPPVKEPDLAMILPAGDDLVGCPPTSNYVKVDVAEGGAEAWCDRNGMKHGNYVKTWPSGVDREKGLWINGHQDGLWTTSHEDGSVSSRGNWDHGQQIGAWTTWWPKGKKKEEGDYVKGRRLGDWVEYAEDGHKLAEGMYRNGAKEGVWTLYAPGVDGVVERTDRWAGGQVVESKPAPPRAAPPSSN